MDELQLTACSYDPCCLGMCEWTDCPGALTRASLPGVLTTPHPSNMPSFNPVLPIPASMSSTAATSPTAQASAHSSERFTSFIDDKMLDTMSKGMTPANTDKCTRWAVSNFEAWREARNTKHPTNRVPDNFFSCSDPIVFSLHLSRYVYETRKTNGEPYPPKTIHQLCVDYYVT